MQQKIIFLFLLISLTSTNSSAEQQLRINANAEVLSLESKKSLNLQENKYTSMELKEPSLIKAQGRVPVLVIPMEKDSRIDLNLMALEDLKVEYRDKDISKEISKIMETYVEIQSLVELGQVEEAHSAIDQLISSYPGVAYLNFLKASILTLKGQKKEARIFVERGLSSHPDNSKGKALKDSLEVQENR